MTINQAKIKEGDESFLGLRPYLLGFVALVAAARTSENPPQDSQEEKMRPRASEIPAGDDPLQPKVDSPLVAPDNPASETKTTSPFIEKYEMGSGKNKINVRIFKEPTTEPAVETPQTEAKPNQTGTEVLHLRLKKDFMAAPTRPRPLTPYSRSKRTMMLEK